MASFLLQSVPSHTASSMADPEQSRPFCIGEGFAHSRRRCLRPFPQLTEHSLQAPQQFQPPLTGDKNYHKITMIYIFQPSLSHELP